MTVLSLFQAAMKYVENPEIARQMIPGRLKVSGWECITFVILASVIPYSGTFEL